MNSSGQNNVEVDDVLSLLVSLNYSTSSGKHL